MRRAFGASASQPRLVPNHGTTHWSSLSTVPLGEEGLVRLAHEYGFRHETQLSWNQFSRERSHGNTETLQLHFTILHMVSLVLKGGEDLSYFTAKSVRSWSLLPSLHNMTSWGSMHHTFGAEFAPLE
jgi:hypothetical protein